MLQLRKTQEAIISPLAEDRKNESTAPMVFGEEYSTVDHQKAMRKFNKADEWNFSGYHF